MWRFVVSGWKNSRTFGVASLALCAVLFLQLILSAEEIIVEKNVTYGKVGQVELKLDLAKAARGMERRPAIVFIHGGAWAGGSRDSYDGWIKKAARSGYVAVTIDYRLTELDIPKRRGKVPFPAQIQDCNCAVRWLRATADQHLVDKDRIGVSGGSAGGHLSLLVGMAKDKKFEGDGGYPEESSHVVAVVNYCGPTDLVSEYNDVVAVQPFLEALCVGSPAERPEFYKLGSPLTYVSKTTPPILTLHGDADDIVPVSQARMLDKALKAAGVSHEMTIYPGAGHDFSGKLDGKKNVSGQAEELMWKFFEKHLKGSSRNSP